MTTFSSIHFYTVLVIMGIGVILIEAGRKGHNWPRALLAFICLIIYPINQIVLNSLDFSIPLNNTLPLHLCDIVALTSGFALLFKNTYFAEITYCWGLAGTLQGLIFPNLGFDFPHPMFWSFFLQHGILVIVALFLPLAMNWRPREGVVWRILFWNQVYFFSIMIVNHMLGTNFGFLAEKPSVSSPLDHLGDWPIYLIWIQVLATAFMTALLLPFSRTINIWRFPRFRVNPEHERSGPA